MKTPAPNPRVVYVMGSGRSGTTLLGSILGEYPGAFAAGEISYLWDRGILHPRGCGCGRAPMECPVWGPIIERMSQGSDPRLLAQEQLARRDSIRLRRTRALLNGGPIPSPDAMASSRAVNEYGSTLERLYRAAAEVTGLSTIVDTSKHPADAALLGRITGIDSVFVHVVRDSRAVTHSWRRRKEGIARRKVVLAALDWIVTNRAADAVRERHPNSSLLVRYEDLMESPLDHVTRIASLAGLPEHPTPFADASTVTLQVNHTVSGNPDRFVAGPTAIRLDDRWRHEMPGALRTLVTGLTAGSLRRYGYGLGT